MAELGGVDGHNLFGDMGATGIQMRGAAGVIIDGGMRDYVGLQDDRFAGFPVLHRFSHVTTTSWIGVEYNTPVRIGNATVLPGDIVVGDDGGVLFFRRRSWRRSWRRWPNTRPRRTSSENSCWKRSTGSATCIPSRLRYAKSSRGPRADSSFAAEARLEDRLCEAGFGDEEQQCTLDGQVCVLVDPIFARRMTVSAASTAADRHSGQP